MKNQLCIRLNTKSQIFVAAFFSSALFSMFAFFTILFTVSPVDPYNRTTLSEYLILWSIFLAVMFFPFLIVLLLHLFYKVHLYVDEEKIVKRTKHKIYFEIYWNDVLSISYEPLKWWQIYNLYMFSMILFIEKKNAKKDNLRKHHASMSYKDALKIREIFYPKMQIALKKNKDTAEKQLKLHDNLQNESNDLEQFKTNTDVFETSNFETGDTDILNPNTENQKDNTDNIETIIQKENIENDNNP